MWIAALTVALLAAAGVPVARALGDARGARLAGEGVLLGLGLGPLLLYAFALAGVPWSRLGLLGGLVAVAALALRFAPPRPPPPSPAPVAPQELAVGALAALAVAALLARFWGYARAVAPLMWDTWARWAFKAHLFFDARGLTWALLADPWMAYTRPDYPPLLTLQFDVLAVVAGSWDEGRIGAVSFAFALGGALFVWGLARERSESPAFAGLATLGLAGLLLNPWAGLADPPLAVLLAVGLLTFQEGLEDEDRRRRRYGAVFLGLATLMKNEGLSMLGAASLAVVALRRRRAGAALADLWPAFALAASWQLVRLAFDYRSELSAPGTLERVLGRLGDARPLVDTFVAATPDTPLFFVAIALGVALGGRELLRRSPFLGLTLAVQLASYLAVYLETPNDPLYQIGTSWHRLILHLELPAACAAVLGLATALRRPAPPPSSA